AAAAAASPAEVAQRAGTIITMLPDTPDVRQVVLGPDGIVQVATDRHLLVDMSTIAPAAAVEMHAVLAARGAGALDAPVSGGDVGARAAALSIMVGGQADHVARAMPLFEAMGTTIVHVGGPGAGQTVKACNQVMVATAYAGLSEALVLGQRAGVDPEKILEVLGGGLAASRVLELRGARMVRNDFAPGFRVNLHRKDLGIALAAAQEHQLPLQVTTLVSQLYDTAAAAGYGDLDHSALVLVISEPAGGGV
ncbi:MAG: NAD(P)-dependent oxidoreductase, partial [Thermomicrobiales bacterium]|nr:NAD(P)-dependent oxidoreductase [Thermomicrobiales bacterium]